MKKIPTLLLIALCSLLFFSCATYTVQRGREKIVYPENTNLAETRYSVIKAEEDAILDAQRKAAEAAQAEERRKAEILQAEIRKQEEAARLLEEQRKAEERARAEALRVNEYPEDFSTMVYPFFYNPMKSTDSKEETELTELKVAFVPLGEEALDRNMIIGAIATLQHLNLDMVGFTGSLKNQILAATAVGWDAVTTEGGTLAFNHLSIQKLGEDSLVLKITPSKSLAISLKDFKPVLPEAGDTEEILDQIEELERQNIDTFIESLSRNEGDSRILFLSSFAPATSDWTDWTDMEYRTDEKFLFSDILEDLKWSDTYAATHYSVETDPGYTRSNGYVNERLDFLYTKGLLPVSSVTVPLERTDITAIVADYLLP